MSHELNTPITAMRGYLETLTMPDLAVDEETRARYLSIIADETARLERIIGDLLDLARLEGGGGALTIEDLAVSQLFARVAARHEFACQAAGITIEENIGPGADVVRGDRDRLEQALQNLAANALRYAPAGSDAPARLAARRRRRHDFRRGRRGGHHRPSTCRTSSIASTRPTRRATKPRAAAAWACRSSRRSSSATAGTSRSEQTWTDRL